MGLLQNTHAVSFIFDFVLLESNRSEPIKAPAMAGWAHLSLNRATPVQNRVKNNAMGGNPRHRIVVSGQRHGDWHAITSEAS